MSIHRWAEAPLLPDIHLALQLLSISDPYLTATWRDSCCQHPTQTLEPHQPGDTLSLEDPWKYRQMPDPDPDRNWRNFSKCRRSVRIEISLFWRNAWAIFRIGIGRAEQGPRWCPDRNLRSRNVKAELENRGTGANALAATRQWAPTAAANLFIGMCTSISFFPLLSPVLQSSFLVVWTILPWCIYFLFTLGLYLSLLKHMTCMIYSACSHKWCILHTWVRRSYRPWKLSSKRQLWKMKNRSFISHFCMYNAYTIFTHVYFTFF
jgi:hypothetical protein